MEKVNVEVVVGLIHRNRDKKKRQFNLARETINQLQFIYDDMKNDNNKNSYSAIVEQAVKAYYTLYKRVIEPKEKNEAAKRV